ncbi:MAG TPA: hypothetical protein VIJ15_15165 [Dermatophilaceae bacterium]
MLDLDNSASDGDEQRPIVWMTGRDRDTCGQRGQVAGPGPGEIVNWAAEINPADAMLRIPTSLRAGGCQS